MDLVYSVNFLHADQKRLNKLAANVEIFACYHPCFRILFGFCIWLSFKTHNLRHETSVRVE